MLVQLAPKSEPIANEVKVARPDPRKNLFGLRSAFSFAKAMPPATRRLRIRISSAEASLDCGGFRPSRLLAKIGVGDEPQRVALTPDSQYAYVANAAGNSMTVNQDHQPGLGRVSAVADSSVGVNGQLPGRNGMDS